MGAHTQPGMAPLVRHIPQGKILPLLIVYLLVVLHAHAQTDSLAGFDKAGAVKHASFLSDTKKRNALIVASERAWIKAHYFNAHENYSRSAENLTNCDNLDFENNSADGWQVNGDYEIVSAGTDPFGGFSRVFPGAGKHSLRLNNNTIAYKDKFIASVSRVLRVTPQSNFINLHFAMVLLNFPHDSLSAARFKIQMLDSSGRVILCPQFTCYYSTEKGAVGVNNFSASPVQGINAGLEHFPVTYSDWQSVGIDLSDFNGRDVTLEVICNWCIFDVDWAYCYMDADCKGATVTEIKCADLPHSISGPPGFGSYAWYGPDKNVLAATQKADITAAGAYTLRCNQSNYCGQLPFTYVYVVTEKPNADFSVSTQSCGLDATFKAQNPKSSLSYGWIFYDSIATANRPVVEHRYETGGYKSVQLNVSDNSGCRNHMNRSFALGLPLHITVKQTGGTSALSPVSPEQQYQAFSEYGEKLNYAWSGSGYSAAGALATVYNEGLYRVVAMDESTGCSDTVSIRVYFENIFPNMFTPNNDGVNDVFRFSLKNVSGVEATVFDRWGNAVYETNNETIAWDGKNKNGQACSDGTFFYLLSLTTMDGKKQASTGIVNLFR